MARPSKTLFTLKGKISPLLLPLVFLVSTLFLNTPYLDASNGGPQAPGVTPPTPEPPPRPLTGPEPPPGLEEPPPTPGQYEGLERAAGTINQIFGEIRRLREAGEESAAEALRQALDELMRGEEIPFEERERRLEEILRRARIGQPGERPAEQATPSTPGSPPEIPHRVLPRLPREAVPAGEEPPPTPEPGTGAGTPPGSTYQPDTNTVRRNLRSIRRRLNLFTNKLRELFDSGIWSLGIVRDPEDAVSDLERILGLEMGSYEESELTQDIEAMAGAAHFAVTHARACNEELVDACRRGYDELRNHINSELSSIQRRIADARDFNNFVDSILTGTITVWIQPDIPGAPAVPETYNIEYLVAEARHTLRDARRVGIPTNEENESYQRVVRNMEGALQTWNAVRESRMFNAFGVSATRAREANLEQRLRVIEETLNSYRRILNEKVSEGDGLMEEARAALAQCGRRPKGREKAEEPPKEEGTPDLSGTWVEMKKGKPVKEWEIKADERGKITLIEPLQNVPGKVIEYPGNIEGNTITARHIIKDPALVDPKIPKKVIETAIQEYMPTWDLDLKVSNEGTIEGKKTGFLVTYDKKTQKVEKVKPHFENELVLKRKEEEKGSAKGPPPSDRVCIQSLQNFNDTVDEQGRALITNFKAEILRLRDEFYSHLRQGYDALSRAQQEAMAGNPTTCADNVREAERCNGRAGGIMSPMYDAYGPWIEARQGMERRYRQLRAAEQTVNTCLRQLERARNLTQAQHEIMNTARQYLLALDELKPPMKPTVEDIRQHRRKMREHLNELREGHSQYIRSLQCHSTKQDSFGIAMPEVLLTDEDRQNFIRMAREAGRQLYEMMRSRQEAQRQLNELRGTPHENVEGMDVRDLLERPPSGPERGTAPVTPVPPPAGERTGP